MNKRYLVFAYLFTTILTASLFAQTNPLIGKWSKKTLSSDFFLDFNEDEFIYSSDKESKNFIRIAYHLEKGTYGTDLQIVIDDYYQDNTLDINKVYSDFSRSLQIGKIPFSLNDDVLSLYFVDKKNEWTAYKMIPFEKKDASVEKWKNIGKKALDISTTAVEVGIALDQVDDALDNAKMQSIADECLKASRKASGY